MNDWLEFVTTAAAYFGLAAAGTALVATLWFTGKLRPPWLPLVRIPRITWSGIDVLVAFLIMFAVPRIVDNALRKAGFFDWLYEPSSDTSMRSREELWSIALATPLVLALILLTLRQFHGTRLSDLGITRTRIWKNVAAGFRVWLVITPASIVIYYLAFATTPEQLVEEHPIGRAAGQSLAISEWILLLTSAIIAAPAMEELLCRGLLLRWQMRVGWEAQTTLAFCALFLAADGGYRGETKDYNPGPVLFVMVMLPGIFIVPFLQHRRGLALPEANSLPAVEMPIEGPPVDSVPAPQGKMAHLAMLALDEGSQPGLAIFTNGLFFAALHSAVWPSPIPLFVLGVSLAWIAFRTSSLWSAFIVHALFNAVSALSLLMMNLWK